MKRTSRHQQRGFTLAEILVTTAIFAVIMIAALTVYDRSNRVFKSGTESADMQQSTRIGFDKLVADLRMAGFDYNRGGTPTEAGQFPQFDEQIEYAGPNAIVFRANFNYNTASATGNGLEPTYTPKDPTTGVQIFPFVTTSNDEIVAYVLRSADNTKNTGAISFYADISKPRSAYPGGSAESLVTISNSVCSTCGVDTTNANPPYTLYRVTVSDILNRQPGTPVAENIRSLNFFYYTDTNGSALLKNLDGTDITNTRDAGGSTATPATAATTILNPDGTVTTTTAYTGAIGGAGQFNPNGAGADPALFGDRQSRATIQSVRVNVIGMNANPEPNYTQPTETIATIKNYRQYPLAALIVPRNLGMTGFPEPTGSAPAPPTITSICAAHCAAPVICWTAPAGGGPVMQYRIQWDTNLNGAFTNFLLITDPSAVTAIIPDNGIIDPSVTWYYRILAENDDGASTPQPATPASLKNSTRPMPPAAASITMGNATNYAVTVGWVAPSANDTAKATETCTGSGCSANPLVIPSQEIIKYRVYRGTSPTFDPNSAVAGESAKVLAASAGTQPTSTGPGANVSWKDSPTDSAFPPGTCAPYYYRLQAVDRCFTNPAYETSNDVNDSISSISPPVGTNAIGPVQAADLSTALAAAPLSFKADATTSACPAPASTNCKINLSWAKVTADNAGNAIGVDRYRLTRYRKKVTDPGFILDTTFGSSGVLDVPGISQIPGGSGSYSDTTGIAIDPADGAPWNYEYTVAAKDCRLGLTSNVADFPTACAVSPAIVEAGASNPLASGDTIQQAWVMNAGDTITVNAPSGLSIARVTFDVTAYPSGTLVESVPVTSAPFTYTWSDRSDNQIYQVRITVLSSTGCTEVHVKYVQDQQAAACAFANQAAGAFQVKTSGSTATLEEVYTLTNAGTDPLKVSSRSINVTWQFPDAIHPDMLLSSIVYQASSGGPQVDTFTIGQPPGVVTRTMPSGLIDIPAGGTFSITLRWTYKKTAGVPDPTTQLLQKICLDYVIQSEPTVTKHCNLVGQSAGTSNPNSCD